MLIIFILILLAVIPFFIPEKVFDKINKSEDLEMSLGILWLFTLLVLIGCLVAIICIHLGADKDKKYKEIEYNTLTLIIEEKRLDGEAIEQIIKYNYTIEMAKQRKDSLWVGWFYSDKIADLPLIEIKKEEI